MDSKPGVVLESRDRTAGGHNGSIASISFTMYAGDSREPGFLCRAEIQSHSLRNAAHAKGGWQSGRLDFALKWTCGLDGYGR